MPSAKIFFIEPISLNTLRPRQNGRRFADDTFKRIFLNDNVRISIKISLKFVPKGPVKNIPALVQKMAWRRSGDKPLFEPMMVSLLTHIYVTRPQWVKFHMDTYCMRNLCQYPCEAIWIWCMVNTNIYHMVNIMYVSLRNWSNTYKRQIPLNIPTFSICHLPLHRLYCRKVYIQSAWLELAFWFSLSVSRLRFTCL